MLYLLHRQQRLPKPPAEVFDFFSRPENLQIITPPFLNFHVTDAPATLAAGSIIHYRLRIHRVPVRWTTEITDWHPPFGFVDNQISGPYRLWRHEHTFTADGDGTVMQDTVRYVLPFGVLGDIVHWLQVRRDVNAIFDHRAERMRELFGV